MLESQGQAAGCWIEEWRYSSARTSGKYKVVLVVYAACIHVQEHSLLQDLAKKNEISCPDLFDGEAHQGIV